MSETFAETYEYYQNFNFITRYLHSFRYKWILNIFRSLKDDINESRPIKVVDIGCGTGNLYKLLSEKGFNIDYIGIEPTENFSSYCISKYGKNPDFKLIKGMAENIINDIEGVDIYIALETFEHIPEHIVTQLLQMISKKQPRILACSVPIEIGPSIIIKNIGSKIMGYMRYKEYKWIETFWAGIYQLDKIPPHDIYHKGFDWRWLKHTIRQSMIITKSSTSPFPIVPAAFAPSICFKARPISTEE